MAIDLEGVRHDPIDQAAEALERRMLKEPWLVQALRQGGATTPERVAIFLREAAAATVDRYRLALNLPMVRK